MGYQFFLSYSRADAHDADEVEEFLDDLSDEVAGAIGRGGAEPAFFDRSIQPARDWSDEISKGLRTSKALVCLVSENYLESDYCGREFNAFRQRLQAAGALDAGVIIPVIWNVVDRPLPPVLASLQYDHRDLPATYRREGLRRLKRRKMYKDDYLQVIEQLADVIVRNTRATLLADALEIPSMQQMPNAFHPGDGVRDLGALGPKNAKFVYVVAAPFELPPQKEERDAYGDEGGFWWCPYQPLESSSIGALAMDVALKSNVRYGDLTASDDLPFKIEVAAKNNTPVAILVDPWTLTLEKYGRVARAISKLAIKPGPVADSCAVFISWNNQDKDTVSRAEKLEEYVRAAFASEPESPPRYYYPRIESLPALRDQLVATLHEIRLRIVQTTAPVRTVENGTPLHSLAVPGDGS